MRKNLNFEDEYWKKYSIIAGIDESGVGSLVGPIVAAVVIFPKNFKNSMIQDSKILTEKQREKAFNLIKNKAIEYKVIFKKKEEIEDKNPLETRKLAMKEAILSLKNKPDICLVDGKEKILIENIKIENLIKGDSKSISIAAASIIAKILRDKFMNNLHKKYPLYNWNKNKGYASKKHLISIYNNGINKYHRKNYEPIKSLIKKNSNKEKIFEKYKIFN